MKRIQIPLRLSALLLLAVLPFFSWSQTGPAGVGDASSNKLWIKADVGVFSDNGSTPASNGNAVQLWQDQSGNGNDLEQPTTASQPSYLSDFVNGYPALQFDGVADWIGDTIDNDLLDSNLTAFVVSRFGHLNQPSNDYDFLLCVGGGYVGLDKNFSISRMAANYGGGSGADRYYNFNGAGIKVDQVIPGQTWTLFSENFFLNAPRHKNWFNGTAKSVPGNQNTLKAEGIFEIGRYTSANAHHFKGEVAELILFEASLNTVQRILVENYLASKYGLTISSDRYTHDNTHPNEVFGIGRSGAGVSHENSKGTGILRIYSPSMLNDGDYLLLGHNDATLTYSGTDVPTEMGNHAQRMTRSWRAGVTGDLGTVSLSFDLSGIAAPNPAGQDLIIDSDGTFANGAMRHTAGRHWDPVTRILTFTNVDLSDGDYLTLALGDVMVSYTTISPQSPQLVGSVALSIGGGQLPYLVLWDGATFPTEAQYDAEKAANGLTTVSYQEYIRNYSLLERNDLQAGEHSIMVIDSLLDTVLVDLFLEYQLDWTTNGLTATGTSLTKNNPTGWGNGTATLKSGYNGSETGVIYFSIDQTNAQMGVGLREAGTSESVNYQDMDFGLWVNNGQVQAWGNSSLESSSHSYDTDDVFAFRFTGDEKLLVELNGSLLKEYTLGSNSAYLFETTIRQSLAGIKEVKTNRGLYPTVEINKVYTSCEPPYTGSADLSLWAPFDLFGAVTYTWYNQLGEVIATTEDVNNLDPGTYSVTVSYNSPVLGQSFSVSHVVEIYNQVNWTNFLNTSTVVGANNTLKKTGTNTAWDGDAESQNILASGEDGWFEFTSSYAGSNIKATVGFAPASGTGTGIADIEAGFYFYSIAGTQMVQAFNKIPGGGFTVVYHNDFPRIPGDRYRVERQGSNLIFKINGATVRTYNAVSIPSMTGDLKIEASIYTPDREIENAIATFGCDAVKPIADLKTKLDGSYYLASDRIVRFRYLEDYHDPDQLLNFKVLNDFNEDVTPLGLSLSNQWGDNRNALNLQAYGNLSTGFYILQVTNDKGENYYLRFKI